MILLSRYAGVHFLFFLPGVTVRPLAEGMSLPDSVLDADPPWPKGVAPMLGAACEGGHFRKRPFGSVRRLLHQLRSW